MTFLIFNGLPWMRSWLVEAKLNAKWKGTFQTLTNVEKKFLGDFGQKSYGSKQPNMAPKLGKCTREMSEFWGHIRPFWAIFMAINMVSRVCISSIGLGECLRMIKKNFWIFFQKIPKTHFLLQIWAFRFLLSTVTGQKSPFQIIVPPPKFWYKNLFKLFPHQSIIFLKFQKFSQLSMQCCR